MSSRPPTFPSELASFTRVGLTRGVGTLEPLPGSFGESEARYREERRIAEMARRERRHAGSTRRQGVSRWTTWLPSALLHRSSPAPQNSSACGI